MRAIAGLSRGKKIWVSYFYLGLNMSLLLCKKACSKEEKETLKYWNLLAGCIPFKKFKSVTG